ncbi:MAG: helix-turn-helix domain-containing protein [Dehalococcoidia bacterium]|nr:helix-turn-helix domain-containing protein [Dehalococcoidia bacterium]MCA9853835.1 helix-turn-helix domain-containing protein [Dehalococcoidia bacterium]
MESEEQPRPTWITLGVAASQLGVSESTVRRWADAGEIRSYRTSGGHRRVRSEDLRQIVAGAGEGGPRDSDRISQLALARVKRQLARGRQSHGLSSLGSLDEAARDRLRMMGRQMVDLFARYMASSRRGERFEEDAQTIGHEYGHTLIASGVSLSAAVSAFNMLRRTLEETAWQNASESSLPPEEAVEALESVLGLADVVLEAMATIYEQQHAAGGA